MTTNISTRPTVDTRDPYYIDSVPTYHEHLGYDNDDTLGDQFFDSDAFENTPPTSKLCSPVAHRTRSHSDNSKSPSKRSSKLLTQKPPIVQPPMRFGLAGSNVRRSIQFKPETTTNDSNANPKIKNNPTRRTLSNSEDKTVESLSQLTLTGTTTSVPKAKENDEMVVVKYKPRLTRRTLDSQSIGTSLIDKGISTNNIDKRKEIKPTDQKMYVNPNDEMVVVKYKPRLTRRTLDSQSIGNSLIDKGISTNNIDKRKEIKPKDQKIKPTIQKTSSVQPPMRFGAKSRPCIQGKPETSEPVVSQTKPLRRISLMPASSVKSSTQKPSLVQPPMRFGSVH